MSTKVSKTWMRSWRGVTALLWVADFIMAKGFWLSALAFLVPFYAYYLIVSRLLVMGGVIT